MRSRDDPMPHLVYYQSDLPSENVENDTCLSEPDSSEDTLAPEQYKELSQTCVIRSHSKINCIITNFIFVNS